MAPARILIAEDDRSIRTLLKTYLESEGYAVEEASNGQETMDAITLDPPPDIVLLDLSMPAPQGMEVLHRLKNMVIRPRPRVIVLTANGSVQRAVEALQLGATDFLEKPCSPERLIAAVARANEQKVIAEATTPDGYKAVLARAQKFLADGNSQKAEAYLRAAAVLGQTDAQYFRLLAIWHEMNGRTEEAREADGQARRRQ